MPSIAAVESYNADWYDLSAKYDKLIRAPQGELYENSIVTTHNAFWQNVYAKCSTLGAQAGIRSFRAIAVIDRLGTITEFLPMPNMPQFACFSKEMVGKHYPAPPSSPYLVRYSIEFSNEQPQ